jgi:homoserine O-acetyltransferase
VHLEGGEWTMRYGDKKRPRSQDGSVGWMEKVTLSRITNPATPATRRSSSCGSPSNSDRDGASPRARSGRLASSSPRLSRDEEEAPASFLVRLDTTKGRIEIEAHRDWAPHGAVLLQPRSPRLLRRGAFPPGRRRSLGTVRIGDPRISAIWRERAIEDDPFVQSNQRGTIAYAFAVKNGRTTQVFINLRDNSETHDREPFVPFGRVVSGMDVVDALESGYGETSGGGIRAGKQAPLFEKGNAYLDESFPRLDHILRATIVE